MAQYTAEQRDALKNAIALGARVVQYADRTITYHSLDDMRSLLAEMEAEVGQSTGEMPPRRRVFFVTGKGF